MMRDLRGPPYTSTTPVTKGRWRTGLIGSLIKLVTLPLIPIVLLVWFGQPALRFEYQYWGSRDSPLFTDCTYLALDGFRQAMPGLPGDNLCPLIALLPFDIQSLWSDNS